MLQRVKERYLLKMSFGESIGVKTTASIKNMNSKTYTEVTNLLDTEIKLIIPTVNIRPANPKDCEIDNDKKFNFNRKENGTQVLSHHKI